MSQSKVVECPKCHEKVLPLLKVFDVKLCPKCNTIIYSSIPIENGSM